MKAKAFFEAMGRRAQSNGVPLKAPSNLPKFAQQWFCRGWILQMPVKNNGARDFKMGDATFIDFRFAAPQPSEK